MRAPEGGMDKDRTPRDAPVDQSELSSAALAELSSSSECGRAECRLLGSVWASRMPQLNDLLRDKAEWAREKAHLVAQAQDAWTAANQRRDAAKEEEAPKGGLSLQERLDSALMEGKMQRDKAEESGAALHGLRQEKAGLADQLAAERKAAKALAASHKQLAAKLKAVEKSLETEKAKVKKPPKGSKASAASDAGYRKALEAYVSIADKHHLQAALFKDAHDLYLAAEGGSSQAEGGNSQTPSSSASSTSHKASASSTPESRLRIADPPSSADSLPSPKEPKAKVPRKAYGPRKGPKAASNLTLFSLGEFKHSAATAPAKHSSVAVITPAPAPVPAQARDRLDRSPSPPPPAKLISQRRHLTDDERDMMLERIREFKKAWEERPSEISPLEEEPLAGLADEAEDAVGTRKPNRPALPGARPSKRRRSPKPLDSDSDEETQRLSIDDGETTAAAPSPKEEPMDTSPRRVSRIAFGAASAPIKPTPAAALSRRTFKAPVMPKRTVAKATAKKAVSGAVASEGLSDGVTKLLDDLQASKALEPVVQQMLPLLDRPDQLAKNMRAFLVKLYRPTAGPSKIHLQKLLDATPEREALPRSVFLPFERTLLSLVERLGSAALKRGLAEELAAELGTEQRRWETGDLVFGALLRLCLCWAEEAGLGPTTVNGLVESWLERQSAETVLAGLSVVGYVAPALLSPEHVCLGPAGTGLLRASLHLLQTARLPGAQRLGKLLAFFGATPLSDAEAARELTEAKQRLFLCDWSAANLAAVVRAFGASQAPLQADFLRQLLRDLDAYLKGQLLMELGRGLGLLGLLLRQRRPAAQVAELAKVPQLLLWTAAELALPPDAARLRAHKALRKGARRLRHSLRLLADGRAKETQALEQLGRLQLLPYAPPEDWADPVEF